MGNTPSGPQIGRELGHFFLTGQPGGPPPTQHQQAQNRPPPPPEEQDDFGDLFGSGRPGRKTRKNLVGLNSYELSNQYPSMGMYGGKGNQQAGYIRALLAGKFGEDQFNINKMRSKPSDWLEYHFGDQRATKKATKSELAQVKKEKARITKEMKALEKQLKTKQKRVKKLKGGELGGPYIGGRVGFRPPPPTHGRESIDQIRRETFLRENPGIQRPPPSVGGFVNMGIPGLNIPGMPVLPIFGNGNQGQVGMSNIGSSGPGHHVGVGFAGPMPGGQNIGGPVRRYGGRMKRDPLNPIRPGPGVKGGVFGVHNNFAVMPQVTARELEKIRKQQKNIHFPPARSLAITHGLTPPTAREMYNLRSSVGGLMMMPNPNPPNPTRYIPTLTPSQRKLKSQIRNLIGN